MFQYCGKECGQAIDPLKNPLSRPTKPTVAYRNRSELHAAPFFKRSTLVYQNQNIDFKEEGRTPHLINTFRAHELRGTYCAPISCTIWQLLTTSNLPKLETD
jgi:hypothetical protein